jgi:hypothetical protein
MAVGSVEEMQQVRRLDMKSGERLREKEKEIGKQRGGAREGAPRIIPCGGRVIARGRRTG